MSVADEFVLWETSEGGGAGFFAFKINKKGEKII